MPKTFLVLRCSNLEASQEFYEFYGLTFVEEHHGEGPPHVSCTLDTLVLELYPARSSEDVTRGLTLGLTLSEDRPDDYVRAVDPEGNILLVYGGS